MWLWQNERPRSRCWGGEHGAFSLQQGTEKLLSRVAVVGGADTRLAMLTWQHATPGRLQMQRELPALRQLIKHIVTRRL